MNKEHKARVKKIVAVLNQAHTDLEDIMTEINDEFENLSAAAQEGDKGTGLQEDADAIERAGESVQEAIDACVDLS
jgi:hypothetical protein